MKVFIIRSFIGIFFVCFIAVVITNLSTLFGDFIVIDGSLFLKNSIGYILLCGWFFTVSPKYFENRKLSLFWQTVFHFFTVTILYLVIAFSVEWLPLNIISILLTFLISIAVYTIFWIAFYLYFKNQVRKLNDDLNPHKGYCKNNGSDIQTPKFFCINYSVHNLRSTQN